MKVYSVSDTASMLNVNEETVRRWIRDGKLKAERSVGRGGNSIRLEDIVAFANLPPRAYLLSLEMWLTENGIDYQKVTDSELFEKKEKADKFDTLTAGMAAGATVTSAAAGVATAGLATIALPLGIGIAGAIYGTGKYKRRKIYQDYSIQLNSVDEDEIEKEPVEVLEADKQLDTDSNQANCEENSLENCGEVQKEVEELSTSQQLDNQNETPQQTIRAETEGLVEMRTSEIFEGLTQAKNLLDVGIITEEEFSAIKARLIAKI